MSRLLLDIVLAVVLGTLGAGLVSALVVPVLPAGEFGPLLIVFILVCIGGVFLAMRRWRRRVGRQAAP